MFIVNLIGSLLKPVRFGDLITRVLERNGTVSSKELHTSVNVAEPAFNISVLRRESSDETAKDAEYSPVISFPPIVCCEAVYDEEKVPDINLTNRLSLPVICVAELPDRRLEGTPLSVLFRKRDPVTLKTKFS